MASYSPTCSTSLDTLEAAQACPKSAGMAFHRHIVYVERSEKGTCILPGWGIPSRRSRTGTFRVAVSSRWCSSATPTFTDSHSSIWRTPAQKWPHSTSGHGIKPASSCRPAKSCNGSQYST